MTAKRKALGRGLGALMEDMSYEESDVKQQDVSIFEIPLESIDVNPYQPRSEFSEEALNELAASISENGIIQPITVRQKEDEEEKFQLITGERRVRASKIAGLSKIPAFVRVVEDKALLEMALVENIQREDLNAIEVAISYQRLIDECKFTQEDLSGRIGKNRSTIANYLRLLKLPAEIQVGIRDRKISMGHARSLINIENPKSQVQIYKRIIDEGLSVRATEEAVRELNDQPQKAEKLKNKIKSEELPQEYMQLRDHLANHFNTKVDFKRNNKGDGKIVIPFKSDDDLERILSLLDGSQLDQTDNADNTGEEDSE